MTGTNGTTIQPALAVMIERMREIAGEGPAPGSDRFCRLSGFTAYAWERHGISYGELLALAGYPPNPFGRQRFSKTELAAAMADLCRELGRFPRRLDLLGKKTKCPSFPGTAALRSTLGNKRRMIHSVLEYCTQTEGYEDVARLCETAQQELGRFPGERERPGKPKGSVYLLQCGPRYKIGKSNAVASRIRKLKEQLPRRARLLHVIHTDDPSGVERYWHGRFADKRTKNEWFRLTNAEVTAFKRWRAI